MSIQGQRLDLPLETLNQPGWYAMAIYDRQPSGNYTFTGYTQPKWCVNFNEFTAENMRLSRQREWRSVRGWRWHDGKWFPVGA